MRMSGVDAEKDADLSGHDLSNSCPDNGPSHERYKDLAESCGIAWSSRPLTPAPDVPFQQAIAAGIAGLDEAASGFRIALSPSPAGLAALARHDLGGRADVVMMPPSAFRAMLRAQARDEVLDHASNHLARTRPGESARTGMTSRHGWLAALVGGGFVLALWLSPQKAIAGLSLLTTPLFFALIVLRLGAMIDGWLARPTPVTLLGDADLPIYSVLVPLYREPAVIPQLLAALLKLDYPPERLDIKILIEEDDLATRDALAGLSLPEHIDVLMAPDGRPRTKPRALNIGLIEARGALLTIYDAEDRPDPGQLRLAASLFRALPASTACLQGRLVIDNADDSLLTRMFAMEYAALFDVVNAGLMRTGLPVLLGGTSNHFRTAVLRQVGGWDAWNVTEDADLAFRLVRSGYRVADLPSDTLEEAPARLPMWFRQRVRWMKGFMQTLVTHTRSPRRLFGNGQTWQALVLLALCAGTLLSALSYPIFLIYAVLSLSLFGWPNPATAMEAAIIGIWSALTAGGLIAMMVPVVLGAVHRRLTDLIRWLPLLPVYCLLISSAAWVALVEYARAPSQWNKTDHGLARTSRRNRPVADQAGKSAGPPRAATPSATSSA
jgi:cellulose synthase/poly-beta-1,6-N-acetylglucosamine synthase-like glycosyltransferase